MQLFFHSLSPKSFFKKHVLLVVSQKSKEVSSNNNPNISTRSGSNSKVVQSFIDCLCLVTNSGGNVKVSHVKIKWISQYKFHFPTESGSLNTLFTFQRLKFGAWVMTHEYLHDFISLGATVKLISSKKLFSRSFDMQNTNSLSIPLHLRSIYISFR